MMRIPSNNGTVFVISSMGPQSLDTLEAQKKTRIGFDATSPTNCPVAGGSCSVKYAEISRTLMIIIAIFKQHRLTLDQTQLNQLFQESINAMIAHSLAYATEKYSAEALYGTVPLEWEIAHSTLCDAVRNTQVEIRERISFLNQQANSDLQERYRAALIERTIKPITPQ